MLYFDYHEVVRLLAFFVELKKTAYYLMNFSAPTSWKKSCSMDCSYSLVTRLQSRE